MQLTLAQIQKQIEETDFLVAYGHGCTYWGHNGLLQPLYEKLDAMLPASGACEHPRSKNKHLDRMRRAANCMYDLYNNGLCNRVAEFNRVFNISSSYYKLRNYDYNVMLYVNAEKVMNEFIALAAKEQGLIE